MIDFLANNGYIIFSFVVLFAFGISLGMQFAKLPRDVQKQNIMEWLRLAVVEAEKELGGGVGVLKLRKVYNMFVEKFPKLVMLIPFDTFSKWVDEALEWMKGEIDKNKNIETYVKGE